ncbi:MAG: ATP-binding cassette domain-containing protein [Candidatus Andersenbacteria bacterium]
MPNPELHDKVKNLRSQGKSNEQIIEALTGQNWSVKDLEDVVFERETPVSDETIITARNVSKHYKKLKALDNASLEVKRGSVTALLGPNGAGKTTLVRVMTTLLEPTSGSVTVDGIDVAKEPQKLRSIIGLAGQYASVDEILTGRENLEMFGRLYHLKPAEAKARAGELLKQFNLEEAGDRAIKTYSGGMRRRLDLAASLVIHPKVLFLDEPTTGLDPRGRFGLWNVIRDLVEDGTTVLLTTQYLEEADQLADKVFVIDHGKIIAQGTPDELKRQTGGDILELHLTNHADATKAAEIIKQFGDQKPHADTETGIVTVPVTGGASILIDAVRQLDQAKLTLSDVMLRRPSLDDVFMKLTGHGAE